MDWCKLVLLDLQLQFMMRYSVRHTHLASIVDRHKMSRYDESAV